MNEDLYQHAESTRRPIVAIAAGAGAMLTAVGWTHGAPGPFLAVVAFSTLFAAGFFVLGRRSGCRVERTRLSFHAGSWSKSIPVGDVSAYRVTPWSEGQSWVHLRQSDGEEWLVPAYCIGDVGQFTAALDSLGLPQAR